MLKCITVRRTTLPVFGKWYFKCLFWDKPSTDRCSWIWSWSKFGASDTFLWHIFHWWITHYMGGMMLLWARSHVIGFRLWHNNPTWRNIQHSSIYCSISNEVCDFLKVPLTTSNTILKCHMQTAQSWTCILLYSELRLVVWRHQSGTVNAQRLCW